MEKVALQPSTPAGGGVAALSAASAAALAEMTANLTMRNTHDEKSFGQLKSISNLCSGYRVNFLNDIDRDSQAFAAVLAALKLPAGTDAERVKKERDVQESYKKAILVPLDIINNIFELMQVIKILFMEVNDNYFTDTAQAYMLAETAFKSLLYHIRTNLLSINDKGFKDMVIRTINGYSLKTCHSR